MCDLRGFVPSEECFKCDRCCRFSDKETIWSPVFSAQEVEEVINEGYPPAVFNIGRVGFKDVRLHPKQGLRYSFICPFFDEEKNCCKIYPIRPFDCRLYPFLIVDMGDGDVFLGLDEQCPYVGKLLTKQNGAEIIDRHSKFLAEFLNSQEGKECLYKSPQIIARYNGKIRMLAQLDIEI